jgi:oligoendopeptidase F
MTEVHTLPLRSEVPVDHTWDLESVYPTPAAWEAAYRGVEARLPELSAYRGRLGDSPATLAAFLDAYQEAAIEMGKVNLYASNGSAVDTSDQPAAARAGQARSLFARFSAAVSFLDPELMTVGFDRLVEWVKTTPELAFMAHYVDRLRRRQPHIRSGDVEEVLALTSDPFSSVFSIYNMLNSGDMRFKPAVASDGTELEVGQASIGGLITDEDREVRGRPGRTTRTGIWLSRTPTVRH